MGGKPRRYTGPIETLGHATAAERYLWVFCRACGHANRVDPRALVRGLGGDRDIQPLALKMRCNLCRARAASIIPDDTRDLPEDWRSAR